MAKFSKRQGLKPKEEIELVVEFCHAIASLNNADDAALFLRDLLSKNEIRMIAKRLKIARMLFEGSKYEGIEEALRVSPATIARVNIWLNQSGEGYRTVIGRLAKLKEPEKPRFEGVKKRYPMYYWPEIMLKEIIYNASRRQKEKLQGILGQMDEKSELFKEINLLIKQSTQK